MVIYNGKSVELDANVYRWLGQELSGDESAEDVLEHAIREHSDQVVSWLNSHEKKSKYAYEGWWDTQGRELVDEWGSPHLQKGPVIGETRELNIHKNAYEALTEQLKNLEKGLTKAPRKRFISALLLRHREELAEAVENGEIERFERGE